jgi:hypothetical protein
MRDRRDIIRAGVKAKVTNMSEIRSMYNEFDEGGSTKNYSLAPDKYDVILDDNLRSKTYPRTIYDLPLKNGTREDAIRRDRLASGGLESVSPEFQALTAGVGMLPKAVTTLGKIVATGLHGAFQGAIANASNLSGSEQNLGGLAEDVLGGAVIGGALKGIGLGAKGIGKRLIKPTSSVDDIVDLWRIQEKGARPMSELASVDTPLRLGAGEKYPDVIAEQIVNDNANLLRNKGVSDAYDVARAIGRGADKNTVPSEVYRGVKIPLSNEGITRLSNKRIIHYNQVDPEHLMTNNEGMLKMRDYAASQDIERLQGIDGDFIGNSDYMHRGAWTSNKQGAAEYGSTGLNIVDDVLFPGELNIQYSKSGSKGDYPQGMLQEFKVMNPDKMFGVNRQSIDNLQKLMSKKLNKPIDKISLKESEDLLRKWGIDYLYGEGFRGVPEYHFLPGKMTPTDSKYLYKNGGALGNNGMFDMTNPNIYKGLIPAAGLYGLSQQNK